MTEEKRVPIPERWRDRHTLLKAWTDAGKHPKTEYTTFVFAQEIVKYFEELGAAEAERDQLKAELAEMQWKPITLDSLPKVGDEVLFKWRVCTGKGHARWDVRSVCAKRDVKRISIDHWRLYPYYRAINPPKP